MTYKVCIFTPSELKWWNTSHPSTADQHSQLRMVSIRLSLWVANVAKPWHSGRSEWSLDWPAGIGMIWNDQRNGEHLEENGGKLWSFLLDSIDFYWILIISGWTLGPGSTLSSAKPPFLWRKHNSLWCLQGWNQHDLYSGLTKPLSLQSLQVPKICAKDLCLAHTSTEDSLSFFLWQFCDSFCDSERSRSPPRQCLASSPTADRLYRKVPADSKQPCNRTKNPCKVLLCEKTLNPTGTEILSIEMSAMKVEVLFLVCIFIYTMGYIILYYIYNIHTQSRLLNPAIPCNDVSNPNKHLFLPGRLWERKACVCTISIV